MLIKNVLVENLVLDENGKMIQLENLNSLVSPLHRKAAL